MDREVKQFLVYVAMLFLAGNLFFIKRLVDELDTMSKSIVELHEEVTVLSEKIRLMSAYGCRKNLKKEE